MFISPQLLHKVDEPLNDDSLIVELKLDGFRCIWTKYEEKVRIYTRHGNEITNMFSELIYIDIPSGTVLDGEIIVTDELGRPDFEAVMERFKSKKSNYQISFSVFDVIYHNNKKITHLPLLERKEILETVILEDTPLLNKVKWIVGNGIQYFDLIKQLDLEGVVFKRINSKYSINKRSHDWLKLINYKYEEVYISGLRKDEFGLVLSFKDGMYAGLMEFMPKQNRKELYQQYKDFVVEETDKFIYLKNKIQCKVKYRNLTKNNLLRIPSFVEFV
jgi:DNA ligase 1